MTDTSFGIVHDATLNIAQKREILSSWASDARAVPNAPALRRLDDGAVVDVHDILEALQALDGTGHPPMPSEPTRPNEETRGRRPPLPGWLRMAFNRRPDDDDDDDPQPCPAVIAPYPGLSPSGAEAALEVG